MKSLTGYSETLSKFIKNENLQTIVFEWAEVGKGLITDDEILKNIPVIKTLVESINAVNSISDKLLEQKLEHFLKELADIQPQQRNKMITKIENSGKYSTNVGETLLHILDKIEGLEKSTMLGKLFREFLSETITYDDFLRTKDCVSNAFLPDLLIFLEEPELPREIQTTKVYFNNLLNSGIFQFMFREKDHFMAQPLLVETKREIEPIISDCGKIIYRVLHKK